MRQRTFPHPSKAWTRSQPPSPFGDEAFWMSIPRLCGASNKADQALEGPSGVQIPGCQVRGSDSGCLLGEPALGAVLRHAEGHVPPAPGLQRDLQSYLACRSAWLPVGRHSAPSSTFTHDPYRVGYLPVSPDEDSTPASLQSGRSSIPKGCRPMKTSTTTHFGTK